MDIKQLWIGENVKILSSSRIGRYEGLAKDGRARVSINGKVYLVKGANLRIYEEPKVDRVRELMAEMSQGSKPKKNVESDDKIDLHIKVLNPTLHNGVPEHILSYQLKSCKSFVESAISRNLWSISIIHGKGAGVLRSEVLNLLENYDQIDRVESIKDNGAQRIYFKY